MSPHSQKKVGWGCAAPCDFPYSIFMRNEKLKGIAYDKRCQRRLSKRSDQTKNCIKTIDYKADTT